MKLQNDNAENNWIDDNQPSKLDKSGKVYLAKSQNCKLRKHNWETRPEKKLVEKEKCDH